MDRLGTGEASSAPTDTYNQQMLTFDKTLEDRLGCSLTEQWSAASSWPQICPSRHRLDSPARQCLSSHLSTEQHGARVGIPPSDHVQPSIPVNQHFINMRQAGYMPGGGSIFTSGKAEQILLIDSRTISCSGEKQLRSMICLGRERENGRLWLDHGCLLVK